MDFSDNDSDTGRKTDTRAPAKVKPKAKKRYQKPRNSNAAQRKQDATRLKFGAITLENRRKQREQLLFPNGPPDRADLTVPIGLTDSSLTPCHFVLPYSTTGIGFAVNQLYFRFFDQLSPHFTIFQFYRYSLAQLDLQRFVTHQQSTTTVVYADWHVAIAEPFRAVIKAYPENFLVLVSAVETYGHISFNEQKGVTAIPRVASPETVTFASLANIVRRLADGEIPGFAIRNTIPGAVFDGDVLHNPDMVMPDDYTPDMLRADCTAVRAGLEAMKTKYANYLGSCTFSGVGKVYAAVSTDCTHVYDRIPPIDRPPLPPVVRIPDPNALEPRAAKRPRGGEEPQRPMIEVQPPRPAITNAFINEHFPSVVAYTRDWYCVRTVESSTFTIGVLSYCGIYRTPGVHAIVENRNPFNAISKDSMNWLTVFDQATPVARKKPQ